MVDELDGGQPLVSVLVPVYNTERYLTQCLDSLRCQTLRNLEIICINDGSTDGSTAILRSFANKDKRFRLIEKKNTGYGSSLNQGLKIARGVYLGIIEPDDFPSPKMFARMYRAATRFDCDLVKCNYFEYENGIDSPNMNLREHPYRRVFNPADRPEIIKTIPSIWTGLYRREMLNREGIEFRETSGASFQDTSFVLKAWFAAQRCVLVRAPLLHYRMDNPLSSVKTSDKVFTVCEELAESEDFLRNYPDRCVHFIPWFHVDKWGKYRWNYVRISEDSRVSFMRRVREEYMEADARGELKRDLFSEHDRAAIALLIERGEESFVASFSDTF